MKVFISWSGERSRYIAETLRVWLPRVIQAIKPWMSDVDIPAGARWQTDVALELDAADFGIICVTPENMSKPWLMFEAGALSKSMKASRVCPLVYSMDVGELGGPIAQFQANKLDEDGIFQVLKAINAAVPENRLELSHLKDQFDLLWARLHQRLEAIPPYTDPALVKPEELKFSFADEESLLEFLRKGQKLPDRAKPLKPNETVVARGMHKRYSVVYAPVSTMEGAIVALTPQWDRNFDQPSSEAALADLISIVSTDLDRWHSSGFSVPVVAFDLSDEQTIPREQIDALLTLGQKYPKSIEVGITETYVGLQLEGVATLADELNAGGLMLGLRQFGTGYSSLAWLKRLPLHTLWMDASFVQSFPREAESDEIAIASAISSLGQSLNLNVIAEGVSNAEQSQLLWIIGVKTISGSMAGDLMSSDDVYKRIAI
jgi:EAL domain-containing protein (putative c-di-GMP-specific phosphodiesterase class I)